MKLFIALLIVAGLASTQALCPNSCSGHGTCIADPKDSCQCYTRLETNHEYGKAVTVAAWTGADCSLRTCPSGYAWAAAPQDDQDHKQKLECSGKGQCDRKSGECKCFPGFNGEGCRRTACPNDCNGHGICQSNVKFAQDASIALQPEEFSTAGMNAQFKYLISYDTAWDSDLHFGCKCDVGYRGADCSQVECPSDADPLDDFCREAENLHYIEWIDAYTYYSASEGTLHPQEKSLPNRIQLFNEFYNPNSTDSPANGEPQECLFGNNGYYDNYESFQADQTTNAVIGEAREFSAEALCIYGRYCGGASSGQPCSGRGLCNYEDGTCDCFKGYGGNACQNVEDVE